MSAEPAAHYRQRPEASGVSEHILLHLCPGLTPRGVLSQKSTLGKFSDEVKSFLVYGAFRVYFEMTESCPAHHASFISPPCCRAVFLRVRLLGSGTKGSTGRKAGCRVGGGGAPHLRTGLSCSQAAVLAGDLQFPAHSEEPPSPPRATLSVGAARALPAGGGTGSLRGGPGTD